MTDGPFEQDWDEEFAKDLVGALVLIGLTYVRHDETIEEQVQMHGVVTATSRTDGIEIALGGTRDGEIYVLPPDTRSFAPANIGSYRLRSTGEVVEDPDYTSNWTIRKPRD